MLIALTLAHIVDGIQYKSDIAAFTDHGVIIAVSWVAEVAVSWAG